MMGDGIDAGAGTPQLRVRVIGTAPLESVEVRNGLETVATLRPYGERDLGNRVKVVWSGAKVRGRDRLVKWDGGLWVRSASILDATPVNFWNADRPLEKIGTDRLEWKSVTTGGLTGVILTLDSLEGVSIKVRTLQRSVTCALDELGLEPMEWDCGGLRKKIAVVRLPDDQREREFSFSLPLDTLRAGDNPIYIRLAQEDGHMAWTSPVYLVGSAE